MDEQTMKRVHGTTYQVEHISVVRPTRLPSRREVAGLLARNVNLLDPGAQVIDVQVNVPSGIPIDVLARSSGGTLRAVDVFDGGDPSWIAHALHHIRWLEHNIPSLVQSYHDLADIAKPMVRATAVVARLSALAFNALSFLKDVPIDCLTVRCFTAGEGRFLALERAKGAAPKEDREAELPKPNGETLKPVELTEAEIADFLDAETQSKSTARRSRAAPGQPFI